MTITSEWREVEFHDALVQDVTQEESGVIFRLADVHLLPEHPENDTKELLTLSSAKLVFEGTRSVAVRAYSSETDRWESLDAPFPHMESIAEALIDDQKVWRLTGFSVDGQWLEWTIHPGGTVHLDA